MLIFYVTRRFITVFTETHHWPAANVVSFLEVLRCISYLSLTFYIPSHFLSSSVLRETNICFSCLAPGFKIRDEIGAV